MFVNLLTMELSVHLSCDGDRTSPLRAMPTRQTLPRFWLEAADAPESESVFSWKVVNSLLVTIMNALT